MSRFGDAYNVLRGRKVALESEDSIKSVSLETVPQMYDMWWTLDDVSVGSWDGLKITTYHDAYTKVAEIQQCINGLSHFSTRKGFQTQVSFNENGSEEEAQVIKKRIDLINRKVNMDNITYMSIIKREVYGRAAWEFIRDQDGNFYGLKPLSSLAIVPEIDSRTMEIVKFKYYGTNREDPSELEVEDVLYFPRNPIDRSQLGLSSIEAIKDSIKLKLNIRRDLLESSKRLWAPMAIFIIDTKDQPTRELKEKKINDFRKRLKPGQAIIHNTGVEAKIINLRPDLVGLIKALETADQEIFGNWQMPKALFAREKTLSKATLEYSLKALYQGPVEGVQRYFKREIERQFYDRFLKLWRYEENRYHIKHSWTPSAVYDPELIKALAYALERGAITVEEFHDLLGWEMTNESNLSSMMKKHDEEMIEIRGEISKLKMTGSVSLPGEVRPEG